MRFKYLLLIMVFLSIDLIASKRILVNLTKQKAYAIQNNKVVFSGRISSGKPSRPTPRGTFEVLEKDKYHTSNRWPKRKNGKRGGAKMYYMLRLTYTGYAMHLGHVPSYPASHGCVRLKQGFAQKMFRWARVGTKVKIIGNPPKGRISKSYKKKRKKHYKKKRNYKKKKYYKKKRKYYKKRTKRKRIRN